MARRPRSRLDSKKRYLQVAFNSTLEDARMIINQLPTSERILIEAGTPLIKRYGMEAITQLKSWYGARQLGQTLAANLSAPKSAGELFKVLSESGKMNQSERTSSLLAAANPYIVADLKTMDRAEAEVEMVATAGANAAIALGSAPIETLDSFVTACEAHGIDAMIDMMNVDFPLSVLRKLKRTPAVVIIHRGVDEERFNRQKQVPLHEIRRIKGNYDIMISIAGGDTVREVQSAVFNDADIVVIWKSVYNSTAETSALVEGFLKQIK